MIHESALLARVAKDFLAPVGLNGDRGEQERVRILCVPSPGKGANPLPGLDLQGYATPDGKGGELNSLPWSRKTVTPC